MNFASPLIVFSHLRWNFVYQRPQHVISRLARKRPVFFIEEPIVESTLITPQWDRSELAPNVTVLVPRLPETAVAPTFHHPAVRSLMHGLEAMESFNKPVVWTYTPSAIGLIEALPYSTLIYDCMDELSAFLHAPPELKAQERRLLELADLVFTGGPSLFESKRTLHPRVYCFPSSVDTWHFRNTTELPEALDQSGLPSPRLGFFGVLDERLDCALIEEMALEKPSWQIVLVGPIVKIDVASLPRLPNIHYMGARNYQELPAYIKGWDVCLMPFAINDATKFISPTKVLEYMAAGKPIVSSPITDVVRPYGSIVRIGVTTSEFIRHCEDALQPEGNDWEARKHAGDAVLSGTSWDKTAEAMEDLLEESLRERGRSPSSVPPVVYPIVTGRDPGEPTAGL